MIQSDSYDVWRIKANTFYFDDFYWCYIVVTNNTIISIKARLITYINPNQFSFSNPLRIRHHRFSNSIFNSISFQR